MTTLQDPTSTAQEESTSSTDSTTTSSSSSSTSTTTSSTTTTTATATTTTSTTSPSSTTTTSSTTATTVVPDRTSSGSASSGASLALAAVLLLALAIAGGVLLRRFLRTAAARKELTSRMSQVVSHGQTILAWLTVQDAGPDATPPAGITPMDDLQHELTTLLAQVAGARRATTPDDDTARTVLADLDRSAHDLVHGIDSTKIAAFRVAVARSRGWLDAD